MGNVSRMKKLRRETAELEYSARVTQVAGLLPIWERSKAAGYSEIPREDTIRGFHPETWAEVYLAEDHGVKVHAHLFVPSIPDLGEICFEMSKSDYESMTTKSWGTF